MCGWGRTLGQLFVARGWRSLRGAARRRRRREPSELQSPEQASLARSLASTET